LHTIKKQILDFTISAELDSHAFMQELSAVNQSSIVPMVDTILSDLGVDDMDIILDRLEIDLGKFTSVNLHQEFPARLQTVLSKNLSQCLEATKTRNYSAHASQENNHKSLTSPYDTKQETEVSYLDEQQSNLTVMKCFIETGLLPWWANNKTQSEMQTILNHMLNKGGDEIIQILNVAEPINRVKRLVRQFDTQSIKQIINLFDHTNNNRISGLVEDWKKIMSSDRIITQLPEHSLYEAVLSCAVVKRRESATITELNKNIVLKLAELSEQSVDVLISEVKYIINFMNLNNQKIFKELVMQIASNSRSDHTITETYSEKQAGKFVMGQIQNSNRANIPGQEVKSQTEPVSSEVVEDRTKIIVIEKNLTKNEEQVTGKQSDHDRSKLNNQNEVGALNIDNEVPSQYVDFEKTVSKDAVNYTEKILQEEIYIENAGMVLFWPFLPSFFSRVGLFANKKFISDEAQQRAVLILQYLVTAQSECSENELLLNKILCGIDPLEPVLNRIELTNQEQHESDSLLQSIVEQWATLKKTSVAGLQRGFLCRQGRLLRQDNGWNLLIERNAYDMLLDSLPWSISLIRTSWMQTTVFVEW
jgi:Contractile injection system tape measure protein